MKHRNTRYSRVVSLSSDSSPEPACARAFLRGMPASGPSTRDLFSWTSSQPGHLHQSGQTTSLSRVVLATRACRQLTSRDYNLLPRGILARIRPGEFLPGTWNITRVRIEQAREEIRKEGPRHHLLP